MKKKFFIICPLGFEQELGQEIQEFWPYLIEKDGRPHAEALGEINYLKGGVEVECEEILGFQINFFSKIASRVLLRLSVFHSKDFSKFQRKLQEIPLEKIIGGQKFDLEISCSESRMLNEKKVKEICQAAWKNQVFEGADIKIYIRIHQDQCSVSLDTTGEHLHFRSGNQDQAVLKTIAPLRENFAAWMCFQMMKDTSASETQQIELVDPMAGSGTILKEAALLYQPNLKRSYSFLKFSSCSKILKTELLRNNYPQFSMLFQKLSAFDINPEIEKIIQSNLAGLNFEFKSQNLFQAQPLSDSQRRWVMVNPPYGERLELNFQFSDLISKIDQVCAPEKIGLIVPKKYVSTLPELTLRGLTLRSKIPFSNNGIQVEFVTYHLD